MHMWPESANPAPGADSGQREKKRNRGPNSDRKWLQRATRGSPGGDLSI